MTDTAIPGVAPIPEVERPPEPQQPAPDGPEAPVAGEQEPENRRRRKALFLFLLGLLGLLLLFGAWYLINRKPITEILPPVTVESLPHYSFSIYGVTAPTGVAVTADGSRIYATQTEGDPKVVIFDGSGKQIGSIAPPTQATGSHVPVYVALNPTNGDVYVSDRPAGAIYVYSSEGLYRRTFDPGSTLKGWQPLGMGFASDGKLLVTDAGNGTAVEFGPDGKLIRTIGTSGEFSFPNGAAFDAQGQMYITDSNNGRLFVYGPDGARRGVLQRGTNEGELGLPRGAAVDDAGRLYIVDMTSHGVQVYHALGTDDRSPKYIGRFGVQGSTDGAFEYPNGVAVDGRARVYVTDWRNNRIQAWSY